MFQNDLMYFKKLLSDIHDFVLTSSIVLSVYDGPCLMEANGCGIVPNGAPELPKNNLAGKCPVFNDEIVYTFELPSVFN
jgi:hypothetical protein